MRQATLRRLRAVGGWASALVSRKVPLEVRVRCRDRGRIRLSEKGYGRVRREGRQAHPWIRPKRLAISDGCTTACSSSVPTSKAWAVNERNHPWWGACFQNRNSARLPRSNE